MLTRPKTTGPGKVVRFKVRKQKRNPRRILESVPPDWERWDAAAEATGLNWSEFARRALNFYSEHEARTANVADALAGMSPARVLRLSEKGPSKRGAKNGSKAKASTAGRKG